MEFQEYLNIMVAEDASDLFLTTGARATIRTSLGMLPIEEDPLPEGFVKKMAFKIMNPEQQKEFEKKLEMNLAYATEGARFRVNIFQQRNEVGMVIRSIKLIMPDMESMGLPVDVFRKVVMYKRGLVLFVGATSSGKSTSLAAMINYRNENDACHIITIEDPMEFIHPHKQAIIEQREVGFDTLSYDEALKNTLRQAPDVILIGEIRTRETMEHAITFAETGHLCLSTLHANNANQAFARILSFFPEERHARTLLDLSLNMRAIISQRLISSIQGGKVPAVEVLLNSPLISELIKRGELREIKDVMRRSEHQGMQTFDMALFQLYKDGKITYDDALANADSANDLRLAISIEENTVDMSQLQKEDDTEKNSTQSFSKEEKKKEKKSITGLSLEKKPEDDDDTFFRR
ncbi:MAG: PilT/PilU family type 4a pilus ATPase [Legionellales bacterium]|nr:PilT/PilU family type 4a pilus ATPase [Legionellales bacterium]